MNYRNVGLIHNVEKLNVSLLSWYGYVDRLVNEKLVTKAYYSLAEKCEGNRETKK